MKINLATTSNLKEKSIVKFLNKEIDFNYLKLDDFYKITENQILIIEKNINKKDLFFILRNIENKNILLVAHKSMKEILKSYYQIIFYPIEISLLIKKILNFFETNFSFENIILTQDNFLINIKNQKKVYVTEKEFEIINIFFKETVVEKNKIYSQILNLKVEIDTKSLDSHLSRIRNKLLLIDSPLVILPFGTSSLKIKKLIK